MAPIRFPFGPRRDRAAEAVEAEAVVTRALPLPVDGLARWAVLEELNALDPAVVGGLAVDLLSRSDAAHRLAGAEIAGNLYLNDLVRRLQSPLMPGRQERRVARARMEVLDGLRQPLATALRAACVRGNPPEVIAAAIHPYLEICEPITDAQTRAADVRLIHELVRHPDPQVRGQAVLALTGALTYPPEVRELLDRREDAALTDTPLEPVPALDGNAVGLVLHLLDDDPSPSVRAHTAAACLDVYRAARERDDRAAADRIAARTSSHLSDPEPEVRAFALTVALRHRYAEPALDQFVRELSAPRVHHTFIELVPELGAEALVLGGESLHEALVALLDADWPQTCAVPDRWPDEDARAAALAQALTATS